MRHESSDCCPHHATPPTLRLGLGHQPHPSSHAPDLSLSTLFDNKEGDKASLKFPEVTEPWFKPNHEAYDPGSSMSCNPIRIPYCRMIQNLFFPALAGCVAYFRGRGSSFGVSFVYGYFRTGWTYCAPQNMVRCMAATNRPSRFSAHTTSRSCATLRSTRQGASAVVTSVDFHVCSLLA